jgi:hypothetical protein
MKAFDLFVVFCIIAGKSLCELFFDIFSTLFTVIQSVTAFDSNSSSTRAPPQAPPLKLPSKKLPICDFNDTTKADKCFYECPEGYPTKGFVANGCCCSRIKG